MFVDSTIRFCHNYDGQGYIKYTHKTVCVPHHEYIKWRDQLIRKFAAVGGHREDMLDPKLESMYSSREKDSPSGFSTQIATGGGNLLT